MNILKNQYVSALVLTLAFALPVQLHAESDQLWTKLRGIVMYDKTIAFALTDQEFTELKLLANSGDANAEFALGIVYLARQEYADAELYLMQAATQGHVQAQYRYQKYLETKLRLSDLGW